MALTMGMMDDGRPTTKNLMPIRLDIEIDGHRFKDSFTWNPSDPNSEVVAFAKRTIKDLKLPPGFVTQIAQSIQNVVVPRVCHLALKLKLASCIEQEENNIKHGVGLHASWPCHNMNPTDQCLQALSSDTLYKTIYLQTTT
ncbi:hypothetical protein RIF29_10624 [Crotalaria pallida]|uniref:Uncharacterized protein n=1 Tax=Crotalaria pallida TaxID=3830 RepID=A0AAN9FZ30_CROPI